jgi:hypothetical protein
MASLTRGVVKGIVSSMVYHDDKAMSGWIIDVKVNYYYSYRDGRDICNELIRSNGQVGCPDIMTYLESDLELDIANNRDVKIDNILQMRVYTKEDADRVVGFLLKYNLRSIVIGSLALGRTSTHDIDILVECTDDDREDKMIRVGSLKDILGASELIVTDWPSYYFKDTIFGDIDIFFEMPTD